VFMGAGLDHAVSFHRPVRTDRWVLIDVRSESLTGVRGLTIGRVFDGAGRHVATVSQEALIRERADAGPSDTRNNADPAIRAERP
jgi:acyl-CoA thioesterase-2